jgi:hypothetical protein
MRIHTLVAALPVLPQLLQRERNQFLALVQSVNVRQGQKRRFGNVRTISALPPKSRHSSQGAACLKGADSVAKVVLRKVLKILRAAGAVFM